MTVEEIKAAKVKLQDDIQKLLGDFTEATGQIVYVDTIFASAEMGGRIYYHVNAEVKI